MGKSESASKIQLTSFEDLFAPASESQQAVPSSDGIQQINIEHLYTFHEHPYPVCDDEEMQQLIESIHKYGVITPLVARSQGSGDYEIISGHRRHYAAEKAGLTSVPVIVRELSDDESIILMVDANAQREHIPLSVKAKAYKMQLDAIKRQGTRTDLDFTSRQVVDKSDLSTSLDDTSRQVVDKFKSADAIGQGQNISGRQIQRYIRLTYLIPPLLEMVDTGQIKLAPAVSLSYLTEAAQRILFSYMQDNGITKINDNQAKALRESKDILSPDTLSEILQKVKQAKTIPCLTLKIPMELFPENISSYGVESDMHLIEQLAETIQSYLKKKGF